MSPTIGTELIMPCITQQWICSDQQVWICPDQACIFFLQIASVHIWLSTTPTGKTPVAQLLDCQKDASLHDLQACASVEKLTAELSKLSCMLMNSWYNTSIMGCLSHEESEASKPEAQIHQHLWSDAQANHVLYRQKGASAALHKFAVGRGMACIQIQVLG